MEKNPDMRALVQQLEKHSRQQALFTKIICMICALTLVCTLVLMCAVIMTANRLTELAQPLEALTVQVQQIADQAQTAMEDLGAVTHALAEADLGSIVENVNALTTESQNALAQAIGKMDSIDIDTLNRAIQDLADIVEPLANIRNIFG